MGRAETITRAIKRHDRELYCEKNREGKLCVYRKGSRVEPYDVNGHLINFVRPAPYFVFALTENWKTNGVPVEWGIVPILERLKAIDLWNRDLAEECIRSTEKTTQAIERDRKNSTESFLKEFRTQFARATNGVNTANLDKIDRRKDDEKWQL